MKRFVLFTVLVMFVANTIVVSAWAKPCATMGGVELTVSQNTAVDEDMPCHENKEEQNGKHCEGICLCLHAAHSQTPLTPQIDSFYHPVTYKEDIIVTRDIFTSVTTAPPFRPPIHTS